MTKPPSPSNGEPLQDPAPPSATALFSGQLRDETELLHRRAERSGIMASLLRGDIDRRAYCTLLSSLLAIYRPLEEGLGARADHPWIASLPLAGLARSAAIEQDLATLGHEGPPDPVAAATALGKRIARHARDRPHLLVAHAYVRYMGDLSGGRALGSVVRRALSLRGSDGLAFYAFSPALDPGEVKHAFRAALDGIPGRPIPGVDEAEVELIREAGLAFRSHIAIFDQVEERRSRA